MTRYCLSWFVTNPFRHHAECKVVDAQGVPKTTNMDSMNVDQLLHALSKQYTREQLDTHLRRILGGDEASTPAILSPRVRTACEFCDALNLHLATHSIKSLMEQETVQFKINEAVQKGFLGNAYKEGTLQWAQNGAIEDLMEKLDSDANLSIPKFVAGTHGSVWLDLDLTGGTGSFRRTKLTRVCPQMLGEGSYVFTLDATFDAAW
jgi:hypothetical protein